MLSSIASIERSRCDVPVATAAILFKCINLRALQAIRVIDVHRFPLSIKVNSADSPFTMSVAGGLGAAKGQMHFSANGGSVDIGNASVNIAHGLERPVDVACVNGRGEAIWNAIGNLHRMFEAVTGNHAHDRTKNFFLSKAHFGVNVSEDRGGKEPAVIVIRSGEAAPAKLQFGALLLANGGIFLRSFNLLLVDLRPHVNTFIGAIANFQAFRALNQPVHKLAINAALHNHATGCGAALTGSTKGAPEHSFEREIEIGVIHDDDGVFAAHLQRTGFKRAGRDFTHNASDFTRSGKRNSLNVGMLHQRRSRFRTKAGNNVHHAFGQACIHQRADEVKSGKRSVFSRLDHAGIAADQSRKEFPRRNSHGKVPWRNHSANANGHAHSHGKFAGQLGRYGNAQKAASLTSHIIGSVDGFLDVTPRLFEDFAHFAGHLPGIFFLAPQQKLCRAIDYLRTPGSRNQTPALKCTAGSSNGCFRVAWSGALEDAHNVTSVCWVKILEGLATGGRYPFTVYEVFISAYRHLMTLSEIMTHHPTGLEVIEGMAPCRTEHWKEYFGTGKYYTVSKQNIIFQKPRNFLWNTLFLVHSFQLYFL